MASTTIETYDGNGNLIESRTVELPADVSNRDAIDQRLDQALDAMRSHVARGTFTAAQRDAAILLCLRVLIGLVRLTRNRLDSTD